MTVKRLGRRDLMKLGAGVVATALNAPKAAGQGRRGTNVVAPAPGQPRPPGPRPHTGYKYTANRLVNNGPMDDTTKKIVTYVREFDASRLTDKVV